MSPGFRPVAPGMNTLPSISGASHGRAGDRFVVLLVDVVDQHIDLAADLGLEDLRRNFLLRRHEALPALLLHFVGHLRQAQIIGLGARHRLVFETADALELRLLQPLQQIVEIRFRLARESRR